MVNILCRMINGTVFSWCVTMNLQHLIIWVLSQQLIINYLGLSERNKIENRSNKHRRDTNLSYDYCICHYCEYIDEKSTESSIGIEPESEPVPCCAVFASEMPSNGTRSTRQVDGFQPYYSGSYFRHGSRHEFKTAKKKKKTLERQRCQ